MMNITLPEALQQKAEALAQREGIDLETLVIRALERLVGEPSQVNPRVEEARRRLEELNRRKLRKNIDITTEMRRIRAEVAKLEFGEDALKQSLLRQVAEERVKYGSDKLSDQE